jgi:hypothetical protein
MLGVHTKGCLDPQEQYQAVLQKVTVMAIGEARREDYNLHVGLTVVCQVEVVVNWQTIILRNRPQVLSKRFTQHQTCFTNIPQLASRADNSINNVAGGARKVTLDFKRAKGERYLSICIVWEQVRQGRQQPDVPLGVSYGSKRQL